MVTPNGNTKMITLHIIQIYSILFNSSWKGGKPDEKILMANTHNSVYQY